MSVKQTLRSNRWIVAGLLILVIGGGFLWSDYDTATGQWRPFGALIPWEWPLVAFLLWVLISCVLGIVLAWAGQGERQTPDRPEPRRGPRNSAF